MSLPWLATVEVPVVGNIPPTGIFREAVKGNELEAAPILAEQRTMG